MTRGHQIERRQLSRRLIQMDGLNQCFPIRSNLSASSGGATYGVSRVIHRNGEDCIRQPCKARGVNVLDGQDPHVAKYAYIDIPIGAVHGTVLSCSHRVCNSSGRLFRYCVHCQAAVAKRNFNVRHAHGNDKRSKPPKDKVISESDSDYEINKESDEGDDGQVTVPSFICVDDKEEVMRSFDDRGPFMTMLTATVTPYELDVIRLLRRRPECNFQGSEEQWRQDIFNLIDSACVNIQARAIVPSSKTSSHAGEFHGFSNHEIDVCSPKGNNHPDSNNEVLSASNLDIIDFASFFED